MKKIIAIALTALMRQVRRGFFRFRRFRQGGRKDGFDRLRRSTDDRSFGHTGQGHRFDKRLDLDAEGHQHAQRAVYE